MGHRPATAQDGSPPATDAFAAELSQLESEGSTDAIIDACRQAIDENPHNAIAYNGLAFAFARRGAVDEALKQAEMGLRIDADYPPLHFTRGSILATMCRYEEAVAELTVAANNMKNAGALLYQNRSLAYYRLGRCREAYDDITTALTLSRQPEYLRFRAALALQQGMLDVAIEDLSTALQMNEFDGSALAIRAKAYLILGQAQAALDDASRLVRHEGPSLVASTLSSYAYLSLGEYTLAQQSIEEALQRSKSNPALLEARALCRYAQHDHDAAVRDATATIEAAPARASAYALRALLHAEAERYAQSLEDANEAVRLAPCDSNCLYARSVAYLSNGDNDRALDDSLLAIKCNPRDGRAYAVAARASCELGRSRDTLDLLQKQLSVEKSADAFVGVAAAHASLGQTEDALSVLSDAIAQGHSLREVRELRATLFEKLGRMDEASRERILARQLRSISGIVSFGDEKGEVVLRLVGQRVRVATTE